MVSGALKLVQIDLQMKELLHKYKLSFSLDGRIGRVVKVVLVHIEIDESIQPIQQKYC